MVELLSDLLEVERCSVFLYDGVKDQLYCKVITGRLREAITFDREKPNILSQVFNLGQAMFLKDCQSEDSKEQMGEYIELNSKLHTVTRNLIIVPIKLGNNAIGCLEIANKKKAQEFTTNDMDFMQQVADQISSGLIAHEMQYNIKKESDEELRHVKGLMNHSYNSFLIPMVTEITQLCQQVLKAQKIIFFMYNKDIDHLYSLTSKPNQNIGQFGIDSIRMKSTLGLSGSAFTNGKIMIESTISEESLLCPEEKDLKKLQLETLVNAIAIPIFDKQSGNSVAVIQAYNFDEKNYLNSIDEATLMGLSNIFGATMFNIDSLQSIMTNNDLLSAQFDLIQDGCVFMNTKQEISKINKSAEILFNKVASVAVGQQLSDLLGTENNQYLQYISKMTNKGESKEAEAEGQLGAEPENLTQEQCHQQVLGTYLICHLGKDSKANHTEMKVPINFYIHRLLNEHKKTFGFCLVFQPIIIK